MPVYVLDDDGNYQPARTDSSASLLVLSDEMTAAEIGAELGLVADRWWALGEIEQHPDRGHRARKGHRHNGWEISSRRPDTEALEDHLTDLLDRIGDRAPLVASLAADSRVLSVRLWLSHFTDNEAPGFSFPDELLRRLLDLRLGLDLGVWFLSRDEDWEGKPRPPAQPFFVQGREP